MKDAVPINGGVFKNDYPFYQNSNEYHGGTDITALVGTPIYAAFSGTIVPSDTDWSYGTNVQIESIIDGISYHSIYAHMSEKSAIAWDVGNFVKQGDIIGYVGMTGNTTGAHVHFEMKGSPYTYRVNNVDPRQFWR